MTDLRVTRSGELMVAQVEAETDAGAEFLDAYMPPDGEMMVVDSGRIILPDVSLDALLEAADERGLSMAIEVGLP